MNFSSKTHPKKKTGLGSASTKSYEVDFDEMQTIIIIDREWGWNRDWVWKSKGVGESKRRVCGWVANKWKLVKLDLITFSSRFFSGSVHGRNLPSGAGRPLFSLSLWHVWGIFFFRPGFSASEGFGIGWWEEEREERYISNLNCIILAYLFTRKWLNLVRDCCLPWWIFSPSQRYLWAFG